MSTQTRLQLNGAVEPGFDEVLTPEALEFVMRLHDQFGPTRDELLRARARRRARLASGE